MVVGKGLDLFEEFNQPRKFDSMKRERGRNLFWLIHWGRGKRVLVGKREIGGMFGVGLG